MRIINLIINYIIKLNQSKPIKYKSNQNTNEILFMNKTKHSIKLIYIQNNIGNFLFSQS